LNKWLRKEQRDSVMIMMNDEIEKE